MEEWKQNVMSSPPLRPNEKERSSVYLKIKKKEKRRLMMAVGREQIHKEKQIFDCRKKSLLPVQTAKQIINNLRLKLTDDDIITNKNEIKNRLDFTQLFQNKDKRNIACCSLEHILALFCFDTSKRPTNFVYDYSKITK